ncbi:kelch-like protein 10 isoform X2 [Halyomorpha halys]|uniref:kelch-like protein 10 isoform X2 n=1 Tax=Halyomorpha halys TaxID=286706 RepID=UPI0006D4FEF2|nr:kelch-like protein 10 isoform X2 [Halyomorpha halys]
MLYYLVVGRDRHSHWKRSKSNRKRRWNNIQFPYPRVRPFPRLWIDLRDREQLCDCTVESKDGKVYRAHRLILATAGEYFQAAFTNPLSKSHKHLALPFSSSIVDSIMEFAYTGTVKLSVEKVEELLPAADHLGMVTLIDLCSQYLHRQMTPANAWGFFKFGQTYSCAWLEREAKTFVLRKFEEFVSDGVEFQTLLCHELRDLARNDYLNIDSEHKLVEAVDKWIMYDFEVRKFYANELFSCIRYATLAPGYIFPRIHNLSYKTYISPHILQLAHNAIKNRMDNDNSLVETSHCYMSRPRVPYSILFAAGGWSSGAPTNLLETYDIRSNRWIYSRCDEPSPRSYHGLVSVNNVLYIIGGFDGSVHFSTVRSFNPMTKQWKDRACMNYPRCYVSCVELEGEIYAIGGYNGRSRMSSVEKYNVILNQWDMIQPMIKQRSDAGAVAVENKIYVAGGFNGQDVLTSVEMYDLTTKQWMLIANLRTPRSGLSLCFFRGYVYAVGGFSGYQRLATSERLNVTRATSGEWLQDVPPMCSPRSNFSCCVIEDQIYVIGGFNGNSTTSLTEMYDGHRWFPACPMNMNRSALAVCVCHGLPNSIDYCLLHKLIGERISAMG